MRKTAQKLVVSMLLAAGIATIPNAEAQRVVNLSPQTDWAVKKIGGKGKGYNFDAYCAVAREFPRRTVLTFAKNNKSESSIALDFQKRDFDMQRYFSMSLDAGYNEIRSFEVRPVSEKGFVVRLGRDDPFFTALFQSRELRVDLEGKTYNFNLQDIERGQYELDTCLSSLTLPEPDDAFTAAARPQVVSNSAPPPGATLTQSISTMENQQLRREITNLRAENARLREKLTTEKVVDLRAANTAENEGDSSTIIGLSGKNALLELENERLRVQLAQAKSNNTYADDAMRKELTRLRTENAILEADLEAKRLGDDQTARMQLQVAELKRERNELSATLHKVNSNYDRLSQNSVNKGAEYAKLQEENEWLRIDLQRTKTQLANIEAELGRAKGDAQHLRTRVASLQEKNTTLQQSQISRLNSVTDSNNTIALLRDRNAELMQQIDSLNRLSAQKELLETELASLKMQNTQLKQKFSAARTVTSNQEDAAQQQLQSVVAEKGALSRSLQELQQQNSTLKQQLVQLETQKMSVLSQANALKAQLSQAEERVSGLSGALKKQEQQNTELVEALARKGAQQKPAPTQQAPARVARVEEPKEDARTVPEAPVEQPATTDKKAGEEKIEQGQIAKLLQAGATARDEKPSETEIFENAENTFDIKKTRRAEYKIEDTPGYAGLSEAQRQELALAKALEAPVAPPPASSLRRAAKPKTSVARAEKKESFVETAVLSEDVVKNERKEEVTSSTPTEMETEVFPASVVVPQRVEIIDEEVIETSETFSYTALPHPPVLETPVIIEEAIEEKFDPIKAKIAAAKPFRVDVAVTAPPHYKLQPVSFTPSYDVKRLIVEAQVPVTSAVNVSTRRQ